ncbi:unnamed protein product [Rangifer tarandus platyrhynchus]|uniref:Uncharacterized protein n=1 Tax=Rangifer tarandus platyrhynchus TaxID=3082113 RepID=A0ACB1MJQ4_RANTA
MHEAGRITVLNRSLPPSKEIESPHVSTSPAEAPFLSWDCGTQDSATVPAQGRADARTLLTPAGGRETRARATAQHRAVVGSLRTALLGGHGSPLA